ncbi:MAG: 1-(5-phosphoribosyl)-5-[(5-phosphoribosylamino)methylideneamino]imidazole-4-carboxamide isomerase [Endomicrobia bacterium]|nr:1-(5-phosphoribosyl)-5-[(5-phosphoribosylamino)methylideneamino]imidazole-4-carboxamide isomerase [Endomicrobiia bacterium]
MLIIPAVDLHQGKCVRLTQGRLEQETVYSNDPVFIARLWQSKGAKRLHLIDLDGAYTGCVQHWEIIKQIRKNLTIEIEFGGGVRNLKTVEKLDKLGINKIIISTIIISDPENAKKIFKKYTDKIIVAVDLVGDDKLGIGGWKDKIPLDIEDFLSKIVTYGVKEVVVTDIDREGLLQGINIDKIRKLTEITQKVGLKVIISGGITSIEDVKCIKQLEPMGVIGVIIGKGLYAETISFEEAVKIAQ